MNNKVSFFGFARKDRWLMLALACLLIIPVGIFCRIFKKDLNDVSAWASMIAGIATYLGSTLLGVFVFYNSWVQTEISKKLDDIDVIFHADFYMRDGNVSPFRKDEIDESIEDCYPRTFNGRFETEDFTYVKFEIINNNFYTPVKVSIEGIYYLNAEQNIEQCNETEICSNYHENVIIDHKTNVVSYYGVPKSILQEDYYKTYNWTNCIFLFKTVNTKGAVKYYIEDFWFAKNVWGNPRVLTETQYNDNIKKFGIPIDITHFNKQLFKRIGTPI